MSKVFQRLKAHHAKHNYKMGKIPYFDNVIYYDDIWKFRETSKCFIFCKKSKGTIYFFRKNEAVLKIFETPRSEAQL